MRELSIPYDLFEGGFISPPSFLPLLFLSHFPWLSATPDLAPIFVFLQHKCFTCKSLAYTHLQSKHLTPILPFFNSPIFFFLLNIFFFRFTFVGELSELSLYIYYKAFTQKRGHKINAYKNLKL